MDIHFGDVYLVIPWRVGLALIALVGAMVAGTVLIVRWWLARSTDSSER